MPKTSSKKLTASRVPATEKSAASKTRQQLAIRSAFEHAGRPLGPLEVVALAQTDVPRLGVATVYRTIRVLLEEGWLAPVHLPGEPARYELAGKHHHHHFQCRACGKAFELDRCEVELDFELPPGFVLDDHALVLYGRCDGCQRARGTRSRRAAPGG
jgi:Fur family transcriptional regulator, ferric uptake regulator